MHGGTALLNTQPMAVSPYPLHVRLYEHCARCWEKAVSVDDIGIVPAAGSVFRVNTQLLVSSTVIPMPPPPAGRFTIEDVPRDLIIHMAIKPCGFRLPSFLSDSSTAEPPPFLPLKKFRHFDKPLTGTGHEEELSRARVITKPGVGTLVSLFVDSLLFASTKQANEQTALSQTSDRAPAHSLGLHNGQSEIRPRLVISRRSCH
jgi:hypothetical protein